MLYSSCSNKGEKKKKSVTCIWERKKKKKGNSTTFLISENIQYIQHIFSADKDFINKIKIINKN